MKLLLYTPVKESEVDWRYWEYSSLQLLTASETEKHNIVPTPLNIHK